MAEGKEIKRHIQLSPARMQQAEYLRTLWVVTAEHGSTQEDLLKPDYWGHVAAKFKPWDRLEVRADDGTFYGEFLVLDCSRTFAKVHVLEWHSLTTADVAQSQLDRYDTEWGGPHDKWRVVRRSDRQKMATGMTKDAALMRKAELEQTA